MVNSMKRLIEILFLDLILIIIAVNTARAQVNEQDSLALVALYNATDGPNWQDNTGWLIEPVAQWHDVEVTEDRVTGLNLSNNRLMGSIPAELGNLTELSILRLGEPQPSPSFRNQLTGSIPAELGNLAKLTFLDLSSNDLTGPIPPELGNLANLTELLLTSNQLTGSIPAELGNLAKLTLLSLSFNDLTGSIPPTLGGLANLEDLDLLANQLTGSIPSELGNLANLRGLYLNFNQLAGSIPPELGNLVNLKDLGLSYNQLTGSIPPELGSLANLKDLSLGANQLTGSIPPTLGGLINLEDLSLEDNQISGRIPPEWGNLVNLKHLYLSQNPLSGTLPFSLMNLSMLFTFWFTETDLCVPDAPAFQTWLQGIADLRSTGCTVAVATEKATEIPLVFALEGNYPNPFNPTTRIRYALPQRAPVRLSVYDVQGRLVGVLVEAEQATGWHEVTFEAGALPSGVYFYRLEAGAFRGIKAMFLVR